MDSDQFKSLVNGDFSAFDNTNLRLEPFINSNDRVIFKKPRKGLNSKNQNDPFLKLNYNYFNHKEYKIVAQ